MFSLCLSMLFGLGSGFLSSTLLGDCLIVIGTLIIAVSVVLPIVRLYRSNAELSDGYSPPIHPLWGHSQLCPPNHEGMMRRINMMCEFPALMVAFAGPLKVFIEPHTPRTVASVILGSAPKEELVYGFLKPWIGEGLLTSNGARWRSHRAMLTPAFHFDILKPYVKIYNQCVQVMIEKWQRKDNQVHDVVDDVSRMTFDSILQCAMSTKTDCQSNPDNEYINAVHEISNLQVKRTHNVFHHIDWIYWRSSDGRRFRHLVDIVHRNAETIISERRHTLQQNTADVHAAQQESTHMQKRRKLDFLDILLQARDEDGNGLSDRDVRDEVDTFMFEGHDTTASGISWILYNLARHPTYQEKCRDEIKFVVGNKEDIEWEDINKLTYLSMCIKESLRLHSPVVTIARKLTNETVFKDNYIPGNGKVVKAGTSSFIHLFLLHRNPNVWEDPDVYDPERFSIENAARQHPMAFVPFSAGPRNCIGKTFAMNEMKVVVSQILRNFELSIDSDAPEPSLRPSLVLRSDTGIHLKIKSFSHDYL